MFKRKTNSTVQFFNGFRLLIMNQIFQNPLKKYKFYFLNLIKRSIVGNNLLIYLRNKVDAALPKPNI